MNSMSTESTNGSPTSRFKRSVSNKIGHYFPTRSAHINAFSIELDEPHRQHGPGDTVSGTVVLNVGRPLGVTHVVVCLYGYVEVFKNHQKGRASHRRNNVGRISGGGSKRWVAEYYGDGFASLFEEEIVLCGEGRLDPKLYHFKFEIDFPTDLDLPTSIDFERGTITYMLTATITRPSSMAAPSTCETILAYRDSINVGALPSAKPQLVTLRAIEKPSRPKGNIKRLSSSDKQVDSRSLNNLSRTTRSIRSSVSRDQSEISRRASPSTVSSRSSSGSRRPSPSIVSDVMSSRYSRVSRFDDGPSGKNITASVQLSASGCLPGEVLPAVVTIKHTKAVRSLHGIVVTLYRQAYVDMHPNLPVISGDKTQVYEDYYPRSRTGLGGLSLSAAGSSQVWRKDLSQTFAPLYIDPMTMSTEVKVAIRVPDDAFPTIRNVPGDMISFKYFVEVVIDIHGKLNMGDRSRRAPQSSYASTPSAGMTEPSDPLLSAWGANCVDTTLMRRDKNTVTLTSELIVGTRDSQKSRGKRKASPSDPALSVRDPDSITVASISPTQEIHQPPLAPPAETRPQTAAQQPDAMDAYTEDEGYWGDDGYWYPYNDGYMPSEDPQYDTGYGHGWEQGYAYALGFMHGSQPPQPYDHPGNGHGPIPVSNVYYGIPPPHIDEEAGLSEKERLRRAEAALLPSQPPGMGDAASPVRESSPSAPIIPEEAHLAPALPASTAEPSRRDGHNDADHTPRPGNGFPVSAAGSSSRLAHAEVAPEDAQASSASDLAPSAPVLSDEDEELINGARRLNVSNNDGQASSSRNDTDDLPRYSR